MLRPMLWLDDTGPNQVAPDGYLSARTHLKSRSEVKGKSFDKKRRAYILAVLMGMKLQFVRVIPIGSRFLAPVQLRDHHLSFMLGFITVRTGS